MMSVLFALSDKSIESICTCIILCVAIIAGNFWRN